MINESVHYVEAYTIGDAWREVMWLCLKKGYDYVVSGKTGSYIGQIRKQLENVTIKILEPGKRPLGPIMPPNIPPPTTDENIEKYFLEYIMSEQIHGNEDYCYDDQTEILTNRGWKLFKDLDQTELVATLNPETFEIIYQKPDHYHGAPFTGKLYQIKSRSVDLMVTPKHTLFVSREDADSFNLKPVEEVTLKRFRFKKNGIWKGTEQEYFELPEVEYDNTRYKEWGKARKIPMDDWLRFLGIFLAEGCIRNNGYYITICQVNAEVRHYILNVVQQVFPNAFEYRNTILIGDKQLWTYLKQFGKAAEKRIPTELLELCPRQLKILLNWLYIGDGRASEREFRKDDGLYIDGKWRSYSTASKELADQIQEICLKINYSADIYTCTAKADQRYKSDRLWYRIAIHQGSYSRPHISQAQVSRVDYDGHTYCVRVPDYHIIYVRRNGFPCWSGNTYGNYIAPQLPFVIEKLIQSKGNTNQATISVGDREAAKLADPPCLRVIDFKVVNGFLNMSILFRSWDLFCGMPENLGGLQLLKEYVLANIENEFPVLDGKIIAYSSGLHLYEQYFDLVRMLNYTE